MLTKFKILSIVAGFSVVSTAIVVPVTLTQLNNNKNVGGNQNNIGNNGSNSFFWLESEKGNPVKFNDLNHAIEFILGNQTHSKLNSGNSIHYNSFIGDFNSAINPLYNTVDTSNLFEYHKENASYAYKTSNGSFVDNLYFAAKSYLEKYRMVWMDANGNLHLKQSDAIKANKEMMQNHTIGVSFYNINDYVFNKKIQINPLNSSDIDTFKKIALRNINELENKEFDVVKLYGTDSKYVPINSIFENGSRDSFINTTYGLLNVFAKYKNNVKYNFSATLNNNSHTYLSHTVYHAYTVPGSHGSKFYFLPSTEKQDQRESSDFSYEIFKNDNNKTTKINNISFKNLSKDEFLKKSKLFLNDNEFQNQSNSWDHAWKGILDSYPKDTIIKESNGKEYSLTIDNIEYSFKLNRVDNVDKYYLFGDHLRLMEHSERNKDSVSFQVSVSTNQDGINVGNLKNDVKSILLNNLILKNPNFEWIKSLNGNIADKISSFIDSQLNILTDTLISEFLNAISQTYLNNGDNPENVSKDLTSDFKATDDISEKEKILYNMNDEWWVNSLYNQKAFNNLKTFISNFYPILENNSNTNTVAITYNSVPVFLIENIDSIVGSNLDIKTIKNELSKWIYSEKYDSTKLINISNQIIYEENSDNFSLSRMNASSTEFQEDTIDDKLKKVKLSKIFSQSQINKFQHLLLSQDDKPELFVNDTGVESAIDLYNDNINKINSLKNADTFISKIDDSSLINTNNVLRLYEKTSQNSEFQLNPLPVNYAEMRMSTGLFNPAVANKNLIFYKSQLESIVKYVEPLEVPIVDINGSSYFLAHIANGVDSGVLTGNISELLNNATNNILSYIKPSKEFVFYNFDNQKHLVKNQIKTICSIDFDGVYMKELWPSNSLFSNEKMYFLEYSDLYNYVKNVLTKKGEYGLESPF